jgi:hypothetical protein
LLWLSSSRLTFWFYTGRVWEDALITRTAARNVWEGVGLTHHASEPHVHGVTSPLGSKVPVRATKNLSPPRVAGLVDALQPTYAVLRPNEFGELMHRYPQTSARYEVAARMRAAPGPTLRNIGYAYRLIDNDFRILRRTRDFDQVVRP